MDDIGNLFYTTSSFVQHFKAIGKFKLKLQSVNRSIRVKIGDFLSCVTLKFDDTYIFKFQEAPL